MSQTKHPRIILRRGKEESILRYHPWIFSGAIQSISVSTSDSREKGGELDEGEIVDVYSNQAKFLGRGHYSSGSIAVRILSFKDVELDDAWWQERLQQAYQLRCSLQLTGSEDTTCYRLVHGEGDSLAGLIIDIYGSTAVVQCHSAGMYNSRAQIAKALCAIYGSKLEAIYDKSASTLPNALQNGVVDSYLYGQNKGQEEVLENGNKFLINWEKGQKTGFFIDQRENRELVARYAKGRKVLNTFCYTGGFSVYALSAGASHVDSVDSSARAVELADDNVKLNFGDSAPHTPVAEDAFEYLKKIDQSYDLIILDPPAFAKHHRVVGNALQAYKRLNARAMQQIKPGGILFTFSCSQAVSKEQFRTAIFSAAAIAGRNVSILHQLTQPADHPISIYHPEGEYLKGLVVYVE
ncbi:MAG: class I SAM-dependent rRNA methyltransferase [Rikenellaceae bacterium]